MWAKADNVWRVTVLSLFPIMVILPDFEHIIRIRIIYPYTAGMKHAVSIHGGYLRREKTIDRIMLAPIHREPVYQRFHAKSGCQFHIKTLLVIHLPQRIVFAVNLLPERLRLQVVMKRYGGSEGIESVVGSVEGAIAIMLEIQSQRNAPS